MNEQPGIARQDSGAALTQARLKELYIYDQETGVFTRRINRGRYKAGTVAGRKHYDGYIEISIDGKLYGAHRLAFLYMVGSMPEIVDHADRNPHAPDSNRWSNLRATDRAGNSRNSSTRSANKVGLRGVIQAKSGRFKSELTVNGKRRHLGTFDTPEEAHHAFCVAAFLNDSTFSCFGDTSPFSKEGIADYILLCEADLNFTFNLAA